MNGICTDDKDLEVGSTVRLRAILSAANVLDDGRTVQVVAADSVVLRLRDPLGNVTTPSVATPATGLYYTDIEVDKAGQWKFRWESDGPAAVQEGSFVVRKSQVI